MEKSSPVQFVVPAALPASKLEAAPLPAAAVPAHAARLRLLIFLSVLALLVVALFPVVVFRLAFVSNLISNPFADQQAANVSSSSSSVAFSAGAVGGSLNDAATSDTPIRLQQATDPAGLVQRLVRASRLQEQQQAASNDTGLSGSSPTTSVPSTGAAASALGVVSSGTSSKAGRPLRTDPDADAVLAAGRRAVPRMV